MLFTAAECLVGLVLQEAEQQSQHQSRTVMIAERKTWMLKLSANFQQNFSKISVKGPRKGQLLHISHQSQERMKPQQSIAIYCNMFHIFVNIQGPDVRLAGSQMPQATAHFRSQAPAGGQKHREGRDAEPRVWRGTDAITTTEARASDVERPPSPPTSVQRQPCAHPPLCCAPPPSVERNLDLRTWQ